MNIHLLAAAGWLLASPALAQTAPAVVSSPANDAVLASFDILAAHISRTDATLTFRMTARGTAGAAVPAATGALAGAPVWSYVWPTKLDTAAAGFESGSGILALAATSHPDFDDTPLYDESADGDAGNDGAKWHTHWVVLASDDACGAGALGVRDIPDGATPVLPATWPGLPLFIDSPDVVPVFDGSTVQITIDVAGSDLAGLSYDGVTAALQVNADMHAPLLCVTDVFDVASGDLSFPGRVE